MPADLRRALSTDVATEVAEPLAAEVLRASFRAGPYSGRFTVKVRKGVEPTLAVGGSRRVVAGGATGAQLFYGTEFGGSAHRHQPAHKPYTRTSSGGVRHSVWRNTTAQFVPARPFVYPTFRREFADVTEAWLEVLDPFLETWEAGRG
jgi:hypothetical protein